MLPVVSSNCEPELFLGITTPHVASNILNTGQCFSAVGPGDSVQDLAGDIISLVHHDTYQMIALALITQSE